ncbi:Avirulence (Avh) protein [Phytophthora megakarya]|uniref:Avirulence (Avh) protein n=1 Tax=Phytophthora megakarya TaxID=4795 RepID=A0A225VRE1_9STRA|nr:Avirulence (Avh) protein [Phytophthora megakarya]
MKYAGIFRNEQETKSWLQSWFNNKLSVKSVAAKLGMSDDVLKYVNSGALAKYQKMIQNSENGVKYARFGEKFRWVSKQKMQNLLGNWALQGKSAEFVTQQLGMSTLTSAQIKTHVNYNALKYFDDMVTHLKKIRAEP